MARILYFITEDWFFCSHFLARAVAAREAGHQVVVYTRLANHAEQIRAAGLKLLPSKMDRSGAYPWREAMTLRDVRRVYAREQLDLVHHVAVKPIIYGTLAAKWVGVKAIVNAPVGMGYVQSSQDLRARLYKPIIRMGFRYLLNPPNSRVVVENNDDLEILSETGCLARERARLVPGAGVDLQRYRICPELEGKPLVVLPARMLWDKGIGEFVAAARKLRRARITARFVLVGERDESNPACISEKQLQAWVAGGDIEWWGHRDDMPDVLARSHVVCLPSYREGLPKALVEATATGRAIVTTDVPGCRDVVEHAVNGLLVPVKDSDALTDAIAKLLNNAGLRQAMGQEGRRIAESRFSESEIAEQTLQVYEELLAGTAPQTVTQGT